MGAHTYIRCKVLKLSSRAAVNLTGVQYHKKWLLLFLCCSPQILPLFITGCTVECVWNKRLISLHRLVTVMSVTILPSCLGKSHVYMDMSKLKKLTKLKCCLAVESQEIFVCLPRVVNLCIPYTISNWQRILFYLQGNGSMLTAFKIELEIIADSLSTTYKM